MKYKSLIQLRKEAPEWARGIPGHCVSIFQRMGIQTKEEAITAIKSGKIHPANLKGWGPVNHQRLCEILGVPNTYIFPLNANSTVSSSVEWVDASKQLPDDDMTVLIALDDGEVWTGFMDSGVWGYVSADAIEGNVTHWAEFPAPPGQ